jgi:hypothetical protein
LRGVRLCRPPACWRDSLRASANARVGQRPVWQRGTVRSRGRQGFPRLHLGRAPCLRHRRAHRPWVPRRGGCHAPCRRQTLGRPSHLPSCERSPGKCTRQVAVGPHPALRPDNRSRGNRATSVRVLPQPVVQLGRHAWRCAWRAVSEASKPPLPHVSTPG